MFWGSTWRSIWGGTGLVLVQLLWIRYGFGGDAATTAASDLLGIIAPIGAAFACAAAARDAAGRVRIAWLLIGAGALSWGIGNTVWAVYEIGLGRDVPFPSLADAGYLGFIPLTGAGLLMLLPVSRRAERVRVLLDGMIVAGCVLFVSWILFLRELYEMTTGPIVQQVLSLAYPVGDVILVSIVLFVIAGVRTLRGPAMLLAAGVTAFALSDGAFAVLTATGSYDSGTAVDVGWTAGFALIAIAATVQRSASAGPVDTADIPQSMTLPQAMLTLAMLFAAREQFDSGLSPFLFWNAFFNVGAVMARSALTVRDNIALNRGLEAKVTARTTELVESARRFRSLVQNSSDVITIVDPTGSIMYQSDPVARLFGYEPGSMSQKSFADLLHPGDRDRVLAQLEQPASAPLSKTIGARLQHKDGRWIQTETTITNLVDDPGVRGIVLNTRDVTEQRDLENMLSHQAFHDPLTGLANRGLFHDRIQHALVRASRTVSPIAVLFLDLDGFKAVNDTLGHRTGDALLVAIARRLETTLRPGDTIARLGGDEFGVLVEAERNENEGVVVAERILAAFREPFEIEGRMMTVRTSVGVAVRRPGQIDADEILREADVAMYLAKARGKNRFEVFEYEMQRRLIERMELEGEIDGALARGEMTLQYQPVVDLATGAIVSAEALLRWHHPIKGEIRPDTFIPIAETTGAIDEIGRWTLRRACDDAAAWQRHGARGIGVAVNLSARQLRDPWLPAIIREAVRRSGLEPGTLTLELTETMLVEDVEATVERLTEIKAAGARLAIDDFGTGYSSLSYLQRFPVDVLKIDKMFVATLNADAEGSALVRAIIKLASTFKMAVVAEGIETDAQAALLASMGCALGQGFRFSPAVPPETFRDLVRASRLTLVRTGAQAEPPMGHRDASIHDDEQPAVLRDAFGFG